MSLGFVVIAENQIVTFLLENAQNKSIAKKDASPDESDNRN